jgi:hypothetical protein
MDINSYERLDIAAQYVFDHTPGKVNRLQDFYQLSRGDIYAITAKALDAFKPQKSGPKPDPLGKLQSKVATTAIHKFAPLFMPSTVVQCMSICKAWP